MDKNECHCDNGVADIPDATGGERNGDVVAAQAWNVWGAINWCKEADDKKLVVNHESAGVS